MIHSNKERIHINMDTHEYKFGPLNDEEPRERLVTYKGRTSTYIVRYYSNDLTISTSVDGPKLETAIEKRSYMMLCILTVLADRGIKDIFNEHPATANYHKFNLVHWALSIEFSLLVRSNKVEFKSLRTNTCTSNYTEALKIAKTAGIVMYNLQDIVTEINELYLKFKTFKHNEE